MKYTLEMTNCKSSSQFQSWRDVGGPGGPKQRFSIKFKVISPAAHTHVCPVGKEKKNKN